MNIDGRSFSQVGTNLSSFEPFKVPTRVVHRANILDEMRKRKQPRPVLAISIVSRMHVDQLTKLRVMSPLGFVEKCQSSAGETKSTFKLRVF